MCVKLKFLLPTKILGKYSSNINNIYTCVKKKSQIGKLLVTENCLLAYIPPCVM